MTQVTHSNVRLTGGRRTRRSTELYRAKRVRPRVDDSVSLQIAESTRKTLSVNRRVFHVIGIGPVGLVYGASPGAPMTAALILACYTALIMSIDQLRLAVPALNRKVKRDYCHLMRDYELKGLSGSSWLLLGALIALVTLPKTAAAIG